MKIAISLPKDEYLFLERLKSKLKISRSELIQQAIEYWLENRRQKELIDRYEKGYQRQPEKLSHITNMEKAQYNVLSDEGWS